MPPWLRLLPRPNAECLFPPSVNSILRRTSIRWRGQRRDSSADTDSFIVQTPFCIRLAGGYPALTSRPSRGGGEPTFSHENPPPERSSRVSSFLTCAGGTKLSFHLPDHGLPHIDLKSKLMLERRIRGIDESKIQLHLLNQGLHSLKVV